MVVCLGLCVCVCVWSDTRPVAVERRYVEHVAVSADSHRFHLTVSRQWGWVWWATGTEDLSTAPAVMFPSDDCKWSFTCNAGIAGLIWYPFRRVFKLPLSCFGSELWWRDGLLTESTVLQYSAAQTRTFLGLLGVLLVGFRSHDLKQSL